MSKIHKFTILGFISLLLISFSLFVAGYRISSKSLVNDYIEESGIDLRNDPKLLYNNEGIRAYLLESEEYYVSLSLEKKFFLWHVSTKEVYSYSENYGEVSGDLIVRLKVLNGESVNSLFIYYPEMFKFNQETKNLEYELVYLSQEKKTHAYVFLGDHYERKSFIEFDDSIHTLRTKMPSYIENEAGIYSIFTEIQHFFRDEDVEMKICQEEACQVKMVDVSLAKRYVELYDAINNEDEIEILKKLDLNEADLSVEIINEEYLLSEKANTLYYFKRDKLVYVVIPELYEIGSYEDGVESTSWEHGFYAMPIEFYETLTGLDS